MTADTPALLLDRRQVRALLPLDECIAAVERAFRLHGQGVIADPGYLEIGAREGAFHVKTAAVPPYAAVKTNANFMRNRERGLPTIQGLILLCDAERGRPLAVMDSIEITILRTGAATAVAARHLAREDARTVTICGCGAQGEIQLVALTRVRSIARAYAWDRDEERARTFAARLSARLGIEVSAVGDVGAAARRSDICVTCTPAREPFLRREDVAPGTFVAAVGADAADKQELDPWLLSGNTVVTDLFAQCAAIGEVHHALTVGAITGVRADLGEVVAGVKPGRTAPEEITIFDSTGLALQDAAAAVAVYERAARAGIGAAFAFAGAPS